MNLTINALPCQHVILSMGNKSITTTRAELLEPLTEEDYISVIKHEARKYKRDNPTATIAQIKTYLEGVNF